MQMLYTWLAWKESIQVQFGIGSGSFGCRVSEYVFSMNKFLTSSTAASRSRIGSDFRCLQFAGFSLRPGKLVVVKVFLKLEKKIHKNVSIYLCNITLFLATYLVVNVTNDSSVCRGFTQISPRGLSSLGDR